MQVDGSLEEVHRIVMKISKYQGETVSIIRQFEKCEANLQLYGVTPSSETDNLFKQLVPQIS